VPLAVILAAVLVANAPALLHLVTTNPLVLNAALTPTPSGWLPGLPYIDGNAGFTMQALGHLAALDWLHGHVPWWNPFEGVGAPLAGEMQSGAFFPLTLLLALHQGVLLVQLAVELVAGWSTYFLVRRLAVGRSFATAAGVAFGLCGTFAWLAHAPIRPVALLPLCLIGVERAIDGGRKGERGGWRLLAVALALSILAGFPETTFIDGLFVAWWAVLRLAGPGRAVWRPALARLAVGVAVGVALAAPLIAAFADYLPYAYIGAHNGGFADTSLPSAGLAQLVLPYSLGPIFGFFSPAGTADPIANLWGSVGGYLSITVVAAGLVGLVGSRQRLLRLGLGGWIAVCLLRTYGFPPVVHLMAVIPGVRLTAFFRYADPSWELAAVVLAALGIDDIARRLTRRRVLLICVAASGLIATWAALTAWPLLSDALTPSGQTQHRHGYPLGSLLGAGVFLALLAVGGLIAGRRSRPDGEEQQPHFARIRRRGRLLMAAVMCAESVLLLGATYLSAPPPTSLQTGSVSWLQSHLGADRFVTLGPISPNYGSYFGIAEANINDLPVPKAWNTYIATHLDPNALPGVFSGGGRINPAGPTPAQELSRNLSNYESVGVRYVVENSNGLDVQGQPFPAAGAPPWPAGPRLAYRDGFAEIWELASTTPVFSLRAATPARGEVKQPLPAHCTVSGRGWDQATVRCAQPSTLVRRVLFMPGWTATSNRASSPPVTVEKAPDGIFEELSVPAGTTTVRFAFLPPHEGVAGLIALLAMIGLIAPPVWRLIRLRRNRGTGSPADRPVSDAA
jgi:hypothetical protein